MRAVLQSRRVGKVGPESPLTALKGVGPVKAAALERLGLLSVRDLLLFVPRAIEPAAERVTAAVARVRVGHAVEVAGVVKKRRFVRAGRGRSLFIATLEDGGATIDALYFNQPWVAKRLIAGAAVVMRGKVVQARTVALLAPRLGTEERPLAEQGKWVPVYALAAGLSQEFVRSLAQLALARCAEELGDPVAESVRAQRRLPSLAEAARELHAPTSREAWEHARRRAALEALLVIFERVRARRAERAGGARALRLAPAERAEIVGRFDVVPTAAQRKVLAEIQGDLARTEPMRRLVQGDVGSGKTLLGLYACLAAARRGAQAAFLAPTEILAEQHFERARPVLERAGVRAALLASSIGQARLSREREELERGATQVAFGTHALLAAPTRFARLAVAVIDEQQRFGVAQRRALLEKGAGVHALLLTATPIPRTLALTIYGELDTSLLAERPPGRGRVRTKVVKPGERGKLERWLAERLAAGERAFWVLPRIDSSAGGRGAEQAFAEMSIGPMARHGIALAHGRQRAEERARALARFRAGEARLLVATSVIEVGIDVPEASAIAIEGAERMGLAQLHQLRGRVGRGAVDAWCFLLAGSMNAASDAAAAERMKLLEREPDGFAIAEADLRQRGMGDLAGMKQAGPSREGLRALEHDLDLVMLARELAGARSPS